ncbi:hypothetical protein [Psychrobacter sp.]|uniref:hypothetical protein n=1 Tax=Psychrobacter sp. TaxID=56811 RepID=UPI0025D0C221|nr:hypothetical protein [Psychrobacter sp.]
MAQVAFSHQFSHHWSNAPQAVKDALLQEFEDIMELLDVDTDLETFEFTVPDLHAHIEAINAKIAAQEQAASVEQNRLETERLETEHLENENSEFESLEAERLQHEQQAAEQQRIFDAEEAAYLATIEQPQAELLDAESQDLEVIGIDEDCELVESSDESLSDDKGHILANETEAKDAFHEAETNTENIIVIKANAMPEAQTKLTPVMEPESQPEHIATKISEPEPHIVAPAAFAFDTTLPTTELDEDFIKELENRIDDYLADQLTAMSEDLKSWLHEQVASRLNRNK